MCKKISKYRKTIRSGACNEIEVFLKLVLS